MKIEGNTAFAILMLAGLPLFGQAIAEHAAASSAAAAAAGSMKNIGKKTSAALENAGKKLDKANKSQSTPSRHARAGGAAAPASSALPEASRVSPTPAYEDPGGIQVGMAYTELLRRFGPPSTTITNEDGETTLWYAGKGRGGEIPVRVRDNKVVGAGTPAAKVPATETSHAANVN
jgi:hypothetical protein